MPSLNRLVVASPSLNVRQNHRFTMGHSTCKILFVVLRHMCSCPQCIGQIYTVRLPLIDIVGVSQKYHLQHICNISEYQSNFAEEKMFTGTKSIILYTPKACNSISEFKIL